VGRSFAPASLILAALLLGGSADAPGAQATPLAAGTPLAEALQELAAFLGADRVELRRPPPERWRGGFA